jgi:hypothetical protein
MRNRRSKQPGFRTDSTLTGGAIIVRAMSSVRPVPKPAKRPAATAQPLLLGAHVRLHSSEATGVIIANSIDSDRVRVRWDDTGEVTHCLRAKLMPVR